MAVMLHMYALTSSTFAVSMIAVAGLVPMVLAGIYGGMLADAFDRRTVALTAATVTFASTLLLAVLAWMQQEAVWSLYVLSVVNAAANSIVMATPSAIIPRLLPRELLPSAAALQGVTVGIMVMAGPALAGVLVATTGYAWTYSIDVVLMLSLFLGLWTLPAMRPEGEIVRRGWSRSGRDRVPEARAEHPSAVRDRHRRDDLRPASRSSPHSGWCSSAAVRSRPASSRPRSRPAPSCRACSRAASAVIAGTGARHAIEVFGAADRRLRPRARARRRRHRRPERSGCRPCQHSDDRRRLCGTGHRRRRRQCERDLPLHHDAGGGAGCRARATAGHLHRRRGRRSADRSALRRDARHDHHSVVPAAGGRHPDHRDRRRPRSSAPALPSYDAENPLLSEQGSAENSCQAPAGFGRGTRRLPTASDAAARVGP
jgi:hypothetical protein